MTFVIFEYVNVEIALLFISLSYIKILLAISKMPRCIASQDPAKGVHLINTHTHIGQIEGRLFFATAVISDDFIGTVPE